MSGNPKEIKKFHWKPKSLNAVAIAQFTPIVVDLSAYPETDKLSANRFHPRDQAELHVGDIVCVLEELSGWYRGYVFSPSNPQASPRLGIFPANHVNSIKKREYKDPHAVVDKQPLPSMDDISSPIDVTKSKPDEVLKHDQVELTIKQSSSIPADILNAVSSNKQQKSLDGNVVKVRKVGGNPLPDPSLPFYITKYASEDPLIDEVTVVLRDWFFNLRTSLRRQDYKSYALIKKNVNSLLRGRRQLLARKHVGQNLSSVRSEIIASIQEGNEMQKYPQIIRDKETGQVITTKLSTVMRMHQSHTHLQWQVNPDSKKHQPRSFDVFDQEYLHKEEQVVQFHHFYFEIKDNQLSLGIDGPYEIHFQILLKSDSSPLSETFVIKFDVANKPLNGTQYLVTNLAPADASLDTIILGKIFKKEPFSDKCPETIVRRPIGITLIECKDIFNGKESQPTIGFLMKSYLINNESNFGNFHLKILENPSGDVGVKSGSLFLILKTATGDLEQVLKSTPIFDPRTTVLVNRINFPSVITPSIQRNKIHITLRNGDFQRSVSRNIEIAIQLRNNYTGQVIDQAMSLGRGIPNAAVYESSLHYHALNPIYNETFTVDCPLDILTDSHLYFAIRALHTSDKERKETKVIAFTFLPILNNNKLIPNGIKDLQIFKYEKSKTSPGQYLSLPNELIEDKVDTISLFVNLCSSKYPQNQSLYQFLNWRKLPDATNDTFKPLLQDLVKVKESEILFSLTDLLECLFDLQKSPKNQNLDPYIFSSILHVIGLTQDTKYSKFEPNIRNFIDLKITNPNAHEFLLNHLILMIKEDNGNLQHVKEIRNTFKIIHYLFLIIFKSKALDKREESHFITHIDAFINAICTVMNNTHNDTILGTQTTMLQYLDKIMIEFYAYFGPITTSNYTIQLCDAVLAKKSTVINYKLVFMMHIVKSPLYKSKLARPLLSSAIAKWLTMSFLDPGNGDKQSRKEVFRKCVFVLAETLDTMQNVLEVNNKMHSQDVYTDYHSLGVFARILPTLIDVFDDSLSNNEVQRTLQTRSSLGVGTTSVGVGLGTQLGVGTSAQVIASSPSILSGVIAATMLIIFHLLSKQELLDVFYMELDSCTLDKSNRLIKLMMNSINSIVIGEAFPPEWANLKIFSLKTALKMYEVVGMLALGKFSHLYGGEFDKSIWVNLFKGVLLLLSHLRDTSQQVQRVSLILDGRIEIEGAQYLKSLWDAIGVTPVMGEDGRFVVQDTLNYHLQLTNDLMAHVCYLSVVKNTTCQQVSAYILYSMMKREYQFCKNIKRIETMVIDELDKLFTLGLGDDQYKKALVYNLQTYSKYLLVDDVFSVLIEKVILNFEIFCNLVLNVRQLDAYGDEYEEDRLDGILKLAFFMKTVNKSDIYVKYIHHLSGMQMKKNNWIEAGLTLMHHSNILEWNFDVTVPIYADIGFTKEQSMFERKEELLLTILEYFDEGKSWELGIKICDELINEYTNKSFEYKKIAQMLKRQGMLYESITNKERYHSEYFRVGFYGKAWPSNIKNKLFIYRGFEFEKISVFCERILNKHVGAMMLKNNNAPGEDILSSNKKYIQITAVAAECVEKQYLVQNDRVPDVVKAYYMSNELQHFSFSRPFRKGAKTGNEFLDLWTEKTIYKTVELFPHALKRSLIVAFEKLEYSPIENALKTMIGKNKELLNLEAMFSAKDANKLNCNPLTMSLNGSVDAPVNGGVPMYKKAFLDPDFKIKFPDKSEFVPQLADAIDEQIIIISRCLDVHSKVVIMAMRPLHENLVKMFIKNYGEDIERLGIPQPTLDVPTPVIIVTKKEDDTMSELSKESGEHMTPLKEMDKNSTIRMKKERGSSMLLNENTKETGGSAKDRLLSKAFGKKGGAPS